MHTMKGLAQKYGLTDEEIARVLDIPESLVRNGLEEYQFNEPMLLYFTNELEKRSEKPYG